MAHAILRASRLSSSLGALLKILGHKNMIIKHSVAPFGSYGLKLD